MSATPFLVDPNEVIREDVLSILDAPIPWENFKHNTIFLTGAGGFLGAYLLKTLLAANTKYQLQIRVICPVRNAPTAYPRLTQHLNCPELTVVQQDVSIPLPLDLAPADIIIHCASQASPRYYGVDPVGTLLANSAGTQYLLEYAVRSRSKRFLFFSSGEIYGVPINSDCALKETDYGYLDPMQVRSCYAESKRIGETMCCAWHHQFGLHTSVVRPFHTYGPGMALDDGRVFADFVSDVVAARDIVLKSDGRARRPFCYISDAIRGFLMVLLLGDAGQAYNIANPNAEVSMHELATILSSVMPQQNLQVRFEIPPENNAYLRSPVSRSFPSIDKAISLGWSPTIGIEDGFRRTVLSYL